ncbi:MAG: hypothetical protein ACC660_02090 [Acidimicrobiales bacterium]
MGLLQDASGDDEPVLDAAGNAQPLWMGPCSVCGGFMTMIGEEEPDMPQCPACKTSD